MQITRIRNILYRAVPSDVANGVKVAGYRRDGSGDDVLILTPLISFGDDFAGDSGTDQADKDKRQEQRNDNGGDVPSGPMRVGLGLSELRLILAALQRDARDEFLGRQTLVRWQNFRHHRRSNNLRRRFWRQTAITAGG